MDTAGVRRGNIPVRSLARFDSLCGLHAFGAPVVNAMCVVQQSTLKLDEVLRLRARPKLDDILRDLAQGVVLLGVIEHVTENVWIK